MGIAIGTAVPEPHPAVGAPAITLAQFLSSLVSDGSCFCCGSPTDLMLDGCGLTSLRCPICEAEITTEGTGSGEESDLVLRAA